MDTHVRIPTKEDASTEIIGFLATSKAALTDIKTQRSSLFVLQDCSLKIREPEVLAPWFLDPGGWSKTAAVSLYFIFPGICTLSLDFKTPEKPVFYKTVLRPSENATSRISNAKDHSTKKYEKLWVWKSLSHAQNQGYELAYPNIHPIYDLLEDVNRLVLQTQSYRISMTQGNIRISKRSPGDGPVLIV
ncbi:hypothetical protein STEG23_016553 [Scotinomys teguina]